MKHKTHKFLILLTLIFISSGSVCAQMEPDVHEKFYNDTPYPSAAVCKTCHQGHYKEWSVSPHAYTQVSPVFNAMQAKINFLTNGTLGDFCIRCHTPTGMTQEEPIFASNMDRRPETLEGVTCVTCHRRTKPYGKISARFSPAKGPIYDKVYGPTGNEELKRVISSGDYDVTTDPTSDGRAIHAEAEKFYQIVTSGFCGSCHDVNLPTGFRLEEAFSEYKASPAARRGISCQDCHMGIEPGVPTGYREEPAAIVGGEPTRSRKRTNHMFIGPDYSVVHPAIFPHNTAAREFATLREWLQFDAKAGWGTDEFEDMLMGDEEFPQRWAEAGDRYEARQILEENFALLQQADHERRTLLKNGYQFGDIIISKATDEGIAFKVEVRNATDGHNAPTGFDAERVLFLRVHVYDKNDKLVFVSGDLDPNGDLRDNHSLYVHNGEIERDKYLFSLQSKFLVRMLRGGEREQVLAVNHSVSPVPFIRPPTQSHVLLGRPTTDRKHRKTIPPLGSKWAKYKINQDELSESEGPYRAQVQIIAGMVPVNLVAEIHDVGFDYNMSARDVADAIVEGHQVLWSQEFPLTEGMIESDMEERSY